MLFMHCVGVGVCLGSVCPGGVWLGGVCLGGACPGGCLPHPPVDRQTPVKILPCPTLRLRAVKIKEIKMVM